MPPNWSVLIRIARISAPTFMKWLPATLVSESANVSEYGLYGAPRPLPALLTRTRPPGLASVDEFDCPAIPEFTAVPVRLIEIFSRPGEVWAPSVLGAPL